MRLLKLYIYVTIISLCLVGCHIQQTATKVPRRISKEQSLVRETISAQPLFQTAEATKVRVGITYAGQKISINGSISVITDSIISLSVQPLLGIEMLRIDLTPEQILVVDKMNRRYVEMNYTELGAMTGLPLTYRDLQAVFLNRMFVIGKAQSELAEIPFTHTTSQTENNTNQHVLSCIIKEAAPQRIEQKGMFYTFHIDPQNYSLTQTAVSAFTFAGEATHPQGSAEVAYTNHQLQDNVYFPTTLLFRVNDGKNNITECDLTLVKVRFNQTINIRKADLSRYTQTTIKQLLSK